MASPDSTASRERLRFRSADSECAAVLVRPAGGGPAPCVVLAHGFGAVKEGGPVRVAERYAAAGFAGLAFDYRHFGESAGEPRQLLDVGRQLDDWRAAVDFARRLDGIDSGRVALWGSSFSGGHVIQVASEDSRVAAVVSQVPFTEGVPTLNAKGPLGIAQLTFAGIRDALGVLAGGGSRMIPIVARPGETAAMATPDAEPGYRAMYDEGFEWRNEFTPRTVMGMSFYRPGRHADGVLCPLLVQVAADDAITPPAPAIEAARRAPRGELITYAGLGHFDLYRGEGFERAIADQVEFLERHLG